MVSVKQSQMISFGDGAHYNIEHYFGNPVNLEEVLSWELARLKEGLPCKVTITGRPYRQFYQEYLILKRLRGFKTVRMQCGACNGTGETITEQKQIDHWSGVKLKAFSGLVFKVPEWCSSCKGFGYREFLARKERN